MKARRIVIRDANLETLRIVDISDIPNAETLFPCQIAIEAQCDMGIWHRESEWRPPLWGGSISK